jgi:hypothetical protein
MSKFNEWARPGVPGGTGPKENAAANRGVSMSSMAMTIVAAPTAA